MDIAGLSYKTPKKSILPTCYCEFYSAWCHYVFDPPAPPPHHLRHIPTWATTPPPKKNVAQFIRPTPRDASS